MNTRIAILGTLSDLHKQPIRYDLNELKRIVEQAQPDLLGVEVEHEDFEREDLSRAPVEVREALIPLAGKTDIVVVPIGSASPDELRAPKKGWLLRVRAILIQWLDRLLAWIQKLANDSRRVNSTIVSHTCGLLCHVQAYASGEQGRSAWETTNEKMLTNIAEMARRDPNTRILIAVQCRRKHWLEPRLRRMANFELANYWDL